MVIIKYFEFTLWMFGRTMHGIANPLHATGRPMNTATEMDRQAFNAAFYALGLRWYWDDATYARLAHQPCERQRLCDYIETAQSHLLRAYETTALADAILQAKRCAGELAVRTVDAPLACEVGI